MKKLVLILAIFINSSIIAQTADTSTLTFISDTQSPLAIEKLFLKNDQQNEKATQIMLNYIATQPSQNIFILGDVVGLGYKKKHWKTIDNFLMQCKQNNKTVNALLGNHDVMFKAKKGIANFEKRFNGQSKPYTIIKDSIGIVMLNSNFKKLKKEQLTQQNFWYDSVLNTFDTMACIKTIIVCCHHSPYTNSKVVGCNVTVQESFVKSFNNSKKCKLFISGHSHNFEQFNFSNKDFLVIGGGGGIHQPLKTKNTIEDKAPNYKPTFHYITLARQLNKLQIISYELNMENSSVNKGYEYFVNL